MLSTGPLARTAELECEVRELKNKVRSLEGGGALAAMADERDRLLRRVRKLEAENRELRRSVSERDRTIAGMNDEWRRAYGVTGGDIGSAIDALRREARDARAEAERLRGKVARQKLTIEELRGRCRRLESMEEMAERAREREAEARRESREKDARVAELEAELEDAKGMNKKLTAQVNKDFETSSIPSSKQVVRKKKVSNNRKPTGRKPGAQKGHEHHPRKRPEPTETVHLPDPEGWEDDPDLYKTGKEVTKTLVSAWLTVEVTDYVGNEWRRRSTGGRLSFPFPFGLKDDVTYDPSCKALAFILNAGGCNVSVGNTRRFLYEASGGRLDMSTGMICQLSREFAEKSAKERAEAVESLMRGHSMNVDFTSANVNGEMRQVLIHANMDGAICLVAREHKGHKGVEGTPLENYLGIVIHDHDRTFYRYGTGHQECLQHTTRYCKGSVANEPELTWNSKMLELVRETIHARNSLPDGEVPDAGYRADVDRRYDELIALAEGEYEESPPTKYYRDGLNLMRRMRDYKENHLLFLSDPGVEPDNSRCERLARVFKRRQHACIVFRSDAGLESACAAITVVGMLRGSGEAVLPKVRETFARQRPPRPKEEPDPVSQPEVGDGQPDASATSTG